MVRKLSKYLMLMAAILALLTGCSGNGNDSDVVKEIEDDYVPVEVEDVKTDTLAQQATFNGQVHPSKDIIILPKTPGKVASIEVELGERVVAGRVLFTLDEEDIQKQVNQAEAALNAAKKSYAMNSEQIKNAKINFERTKTLYEQGAVSKSQYEQAELAASDKALEAAEAQVNQAQISYNQAKEALDNAVITAPIDGIVASMNIDEGEYASNAQPAMNIIAADELYIQISVTDSIVRKLEKGQEVMVKSDSISESITGIIETINPTSDPRTQLYPIKISLENIDNKIIPGMFAKVVIDTDTRENVLIIRGEAIVERDGRSLVYVVEDDHAVEKEVVTGLDAGLYIEVKEGLKENESIIIKGQNYVEDGTKVKVVRGDK